MTVSIHQQVMDNKLCYNQDWYNEDVYTRQEQGQQKQWGYFNNGRCTILEIETENKTEEIKMQEM